ncbi:hypothetical protein [Vibrio splendidus]|uniref:hypothetical protein n=1 Tax=Vibrio splendidus TaxID=29497 RepID=UPI0021192AFC|nr:hypothetical protein [Vibrio splendidus]MCQ8869742.1 hypothetical protein [Vibrio splendidus]
MKRLLLIAVFSMFALGANASDLNYTGRYEDLLRKRCSDTPPARSLLPDGSLVCEGEFHDPDAICTGGFNYADSDIFNCGAPATSDDVNNNGIVDGFEDWDGDGLTNANDPNPYQPENPAPDENRNGIPDDIEGVYEELRHTQEILYCNNDDDMCHQMRYAMRDLTKSNQILANSLSNASLKNVRRTDFRESVGALTTTVNQKSQAILDAVNSIEVGGGVDNSGIINKGFADMKAGFADMETNFDDVDENLFRSINATRDAKDDILRALNNSSGVGLTSSQERQLRDAAKAKNNGTKLNDIKNYTSDTNRSISQVKDQVNTTLGAVASQAGRFSNLEGKISSLNGRFDSVDGQFSQLSDQIAAISGGQSTVDLSGVESSIDALSDKIDGIEDGGNGEGLAEISSKLDGLATGVTDIGDLLKSVDASKAGIDGTCIQGGTCQSFYESAYEGDLSTVVSSQLDAMKTSIVDPFVSSFGNIDLSGAQRPKFGLPVPFYGYMSFDDYIDMDWIFGFLRFIFLASTAFYCRQIIFGG